MEMNEITFLDPADARAELQHLAKTDFGQARIVGTIANAYPAKALPIIIKAFESAPDRTRLVIIGDGPDMASVRAAREASSAKKRIYLLGSVADAARLLKGFDLFALSSVKEGLPWVILEASLAGVPVVATEVGGIPELVEQREALLVPPGDAKAFGEALHSVLTDDILYAKMKNDVPRIAERRSGQVMIESTLAVYRRLL
jgi:glycosyltransferase involved in cell wall biosynthesis